MYGFTQFDGAIDSGADWYSGAWFRNGLGRTERQQ